MKDKEQIRQALPVKRALTSPGGAVCGVDVDKKKRAHVLWRPHDWATRADLIKHA